MVGSKHGDVVHKLLMKALSFVAELGPREVPAEPLHAGLSLYTTHRVSASLVLSETLQCLRR